MMHSLIYEGRFCTFYPVTHLDDVNIDLIRPFVFVTQAAAVGFMNKFNLPVATNPCPFDHDSERTYVRNLLADINKHAKGVKKRMMTAICDGTLEHWTKK